MKCFDKPKIELCKSLLNIPPVIISCRYCKSSAFISANIIILWAAAYLIAFARIPLMQGFMLQEERTDYFLYDGPNASWFHDVVVLAPQIIEGNLNSVVISLLLWIDRVLLKLLSLRNIILNSTSFIYIWSSQQH